MPLMKRSRARILAVQALCAFDAQGEAFASALDGFLHDRANYADLGWKRQPEPALLDFARELATGTWQQRDRYDELLRQNAGGWPLERMQPVDRNILRLGLHELLECPTACWTDCDASCLRLWVSRPRHRRLRAQGSGCPPVAAVGVSLSCRVQRRPRGADATTASFYGFA